MIVCVYVNSEVGSPQTGSRALTAANKKREVDDDVRTRTVRVSFLRMWDSQGVDKCGEYSRHARSDRVTFQYFIP